MSNYKQDNLFNDLVTQANIVDVIASYIPVEKQGRNHRAVCPFHDDTNPSLMISTDKQIFKCFVCGTGGNALSFVQKYEKISYPQAAIKLASLIGYHDERLDNLEKKSPIQQELSPYYAVLDDLSKYYQYGLMTEEGQQAYEYLKNRGLDDEMIKKYQLGYALSSPGASREYLIQKGHTPRILDELDLFVGENQLNDRMRGRVVFPITNIRGQTLGFSGRILNDVANVAKYINSSESRLFKKNTILFNLGNAAQSARIDGYIYVVEGFMDVFALDQIGINSAVAAMGTAFTGEHANILRSLNVEVKLAFDADNAGQAAMMKAGELLARSEINFRLVESGPETRDSDEILKQNGEEALKTYLNSLVTFPEFALNYYQKNDTLTNVQERRDLVATMMPIIAKIKSPLIREEMFAKLANVSKFDVGSIKKTYDNYIKRSKNKISSSVNDYHPERQVLRRFTLAERYMLSAMINDERAIDYYEKNIKYFYDEIYRIIAEYLIDYYHKNEKIEVANIINNLQAADNMPLQDEVVEELSTLALEKNVPEYSEAAMDEYKEAINKERVETLAKTRLNNLLKGKSEAEQVQILNEYHKTRAKALNEKNKKTDKKT